MVMIPGLDAANLGGMISSAIYWLFWILIAALIVGIFIAGYYYINFNISATIFPIYGSGKDGVFTVGSPKKNKIKALKEGNMWQSLYPLFNKRRREPFDGEYIYHKGNKKTVYVFDFNGEWIPGRININYSEEQIRAQINPVPYWVRNWADAEKRINEIEFAHNDWWAENKSFVYMLISVAICCALCGATIYFTYKFATGGVQNIQGLTNVLKSVTSTGAPPG